MKKTSMTHTAAFAAYDDGLSTRRKCRPALSPRRCEICRAIFLPRRALAAACPDCAARGRQEHREMPYSRVCHDCGAPTTDYRCEPCRTKWKIRHGVEEDTFEY